MAQWVYAGWYLPITWQTFRSLSRVEREVMIDALSTHIERICEKGGGGSDRRDRKEGF